MERHFMDPVTGDIHPESHYQRENIDLATLKVLDAYDPDERLAPRAPASEHATQFCLEVMRPRDKRARAIERARTAARWERALAI